MNCCPIAGWPRLLPDRFAAVNLGWQRAYVIPAIGRFLGKTLPVLSVGYALYDLARELDITASNGNGELVLTKIVDGDMRSVVCQGVTYTGTITSVTAQCAAAYTAYWRNEGYGSCSITPTGSSATMMQTTASNCGGNGYYNTHTSRVPGAASTRIITEQEFLNDIASKSGWPSTSALARLTVEAIKYGETFDEKSPTLSGPATSPGPSVTKTDTATNTTSTKSTTNNHVYVGPTVTTTTNTTNVDVDTTTNNVINTTTTTETPITPDEQKEFCDTHPEANGCREDEFDIPDGEIPETTKNITFEPVDLGLGGGSCPPNIVKTYSGTTLTVFDWADSCSKITTYAKPAILLMAIFTAMGIIFIGVPVK